MIIAGEIYLILIKNKYQNKYVIYIIYIIILDD